MYPHERSLVQRLRGRPFVLLGVNSDQDREELKQVVVDEQITWRSWWDGGSTDGPIASAWRVSGWPTIYLIDHEGVIRDSDPRDLDAAIDLLVAEAEDEHAAAADDTNSPDN